MPDSVMRWTLTAFTVFQVVICPLISFFLIEIQLIWRSMGKDSYFHWAATCLCIMILLSASAASALSIIRFLRSNV